MTENCLGFYFFKRSFFLISCFILVGHLNVRGQSTDSANANLNHWYDQIVGVENNGLYTGPIFLMVSRSRYTHPFFLEKTWQSGTVVYGEDPYLDVPLIFDISTYQLVLKHPDISRRDGIKLNMKKVSAFDIGSHHFERLEENDGGSGFYDILYAGIHFSLGAMRMKTETKTADGINFVENQKYFLFTQGTLTPLRKKGDLLKVNEHTKELIGEITKKNGIKFKLKNENELVQLMQLLDEQLN